MATTIKKKISVKDSAAKTSGKPLPGDKTLGIEQDIRFYTIEDGDETAEREQAWILVIHDSNLALSKQNLVNSKFPYIDMFDHEGPAVVSTMLELKSGVFEHLGITSPMELDQSIAYMQCITRGDLSR